MFTFAVMMMMMKMMLIDGDGKWCISYTLVESKKGTASLLSEKLISLNIEIVF